MDKNSVPDSNKEKTRRLLILAVILILDIGLITGLYFHDKNRTANKQIVISVQTNKKVAKPSSPNKMSKDKPNVASTSAGGSLTNTGPGDIVGVFAVTALFGATAHYIYSQKKLAKEKSNK